MIDAQRRVSAGPRLQGLSALADCPPLSDYYRERAVGPRAQRAALGLGVGGELGELGRVRRFGLGCACLGVLVARIEVRNDLRRMMRRHAEDT